MSILVWAMIGVAVWHFAVLVPDKFIGAFLAAVAGALAAGYLLPSPGVPSDNPPGFNKAILRERCVEPRVSQAGSGS